MKTTLALAALLFGSAAFSDLLAQGQFLWGNNLSGVRSAIYGVPAAGTTPIDQVRRGNTAGGTPAGNQTYTGPLLAGSGYTLAIYLGLSASEVMANNTPPSVLGTNPFRTGAAAGYVTGLTTGADGIPGGTVNVNYQFRAWDNRNGTVTSWAQVMAAGGTVAAGTSDIYVFGAALASGAGTPPLTDGVRSFQLTQMVPEPSLIALGALGLGALLLRRRK
jgi:hypothetical protein